MEGVCHVGLCQTTSKGTCDCELCICRHPQLNGDYRSVTSSQTTTEADNSFAEGVGESAKAMDPALLQVLSYAANLTFQEEEDSLGKVRGGSQLGQLKHACVLNVMFV